MHKSTHTQEEVPLYQVTIGDRGQIILPNALRKSLPAHPHEKFLIFHAPGDASVLVLMPVDSLPEIVHYLAGFIEQG